MTTPLKVTVFHSQLTAASPTASYIEGGALSNTIGSFMFPSPKTPSQKFTPIQLIPPVKIKPTLAEIQPSSLNSTKHRAQPSKTKVFHFNLIDEDANNLKEDKCELDAYQIKPNSERAQQIYREVYRRIDKIVQKKQLYNTKKQSVYTTIANQSRTDRLMPRSLGITSPTSKNQPKVLDASNFYMGDKYAKVLCMGIRSVPDNYDQVNLKNNNLSSRSGEALRQLIPAKVKGLNLEGNQFGYQSTELMQQLVNSKYGNLQNLNLESNKFADLAAIQLFKALGENSKIFKLNLSRNLLTDLSMGDFRDLLIKNNSIAEVYLHWNRIHSDGGSQILLGLAHNASVRVLDLSFNSLGIQAKDQIHYKHSQPPSYWGDYIKTSQHLVHLDLSNNHFSNAVAEHISQCLEANHTLYGFHFSGNVPCIIDYQEFLLCQSQLQSKGDVSNQILLKKQDEYQTGTHGALEYKRINGVSSKKRYNFFNQEICWICDGWVEHTFYWQPNHLDIKKEPLYIHFSHERYAPVKLELMNEQYVERSPMTQKPQQTQKIWYARRMVPSRSKILFFFSSPLLKKAQVSQRYDQEDWPKDERNKRVVFYTQDDRSFAFKRPSQCNTIEVEYQSIFDEQGFDKLVSCQPRMKDFTVFINIDIPDSAEPESQIEDFFKQCHRDNDQDFKSCFEADWSRSSIPKFIKEEGQAEDVKNYLRGIYRDIVSAYRHYSAYSPSGDVWCIPLNQYTDVFSNILVDKSYQLKDLDITFKQTTSPYINEARQNTANALLRFQFMEIIVRLAMDKYCKGFSTMTPYEALRRVYEHDGLQKRFESVQESQEWRDVLYWSPECNNIIYKYQTLLQQLYQAALSFRSLPYFTTKQFINPSAFREFFMKAGLINDVNAERNVNLSYCLSVVLVVDEVNMDDHMQMDYHQFVEALARVSDKYGQRQLSATSEQLAIRLEALIKMISEFHHLNTEESVLRGSQKRSTILRTKTSFVQEKMNHILFEMDGSPLAK